MRNLVAVAGLCAFASFAMAGAHAKSVLKDGGFEKPVVPTGSFTSFANNQKFGPWTVIGGGSVAIVSGTFTQGGYSFPASAGKQWLDLTGDNSNGAEGVAQTIKTVAGTTYQLQFRVGNVSGGIWGTSSTVNVLINGTQVFTATNAIAGMVQKFKTFKTTFQAAGPTTTVAFVNGDPSNDNTNALDAVSCTAIAP